MSATSPAAGRERAPGSGPTVALAPAERAWLALLPCALVAVCALVLLGPPLGRLLVRPGPYELWPTSWWNAQGQAEPHEQGRYVLAALAPLLLAAVVLAAPRFAAALSDGARKALVLASQLAVACFVALAVLGQNDVVLADPPRPGIFGIWTFAAAALLLTGTLAAMRGSLRATVKRLARETRARRLAGLAIATLVAALWMLRAVTTDGLTENIGFQNWTLNDAFAILNGRTPLVDYRPVYGKLMPYPAALALLAFGKTALVYSLLMTVLSVLALLAVYAVYRRITRSSLLALVLFVPFVATGAIGDTQIMPAMWPMRYGGAYLLAWLTVRQLDGARPRHAATLAFAATLVVVNSSEFGLATLCATVAALLCARAPTTLRALRALALQLGAGVLAALATLAAFALALAGALPSREALTEWPRIFVGLGWFSTPMPIAGLHLALYATFAAAIVTAAVRVRAGDRGLLTAMLAWSGVFGIVAGSYYVSGSNEVKLAGMLSAWSFALGFLTIAVVGALEARGWRRPSPAQLLVLLGFAVTACSISRLPPPQEQLATLTESTPPLAYRMAAEQFVEQRTTPGETVAIMLPEGFRIAYDLDLRNVAPYQMENAIVTRRQLDTLIDAVRREDVARIFVPAPGSRLTGEGDTPPEHLDVFAAAGYAVRSSDYGMLELARD